MANELKHWRDYISHLEGRKPHPELATFYARYKFAFNFEGINVKGMAPGSLQIYGLVSKIALAYSALECLEKYTQSPPSPSIFAPDLARRAKSKLPLGELGLEKRMFLTSALRQRIRRLFEGSDDTDVRPIVEQFRHSFFHGKFTPAGWGLGSGKDSLEWLEGLAQVTLRKADDTFTEWFLSQAKN